MKPRDFVFIDDALDLRIVELIDAQTPFSEIPTLMKDFVQKHPIAWTLWRTTLLFFVDSLADDDALFFEYDLAALRAVFHALADATQWPFLVQPPWGTHRVLASIGDHHDQCGDLRHNLTSFSAWPTPRQFGRRPAVLFGTRTPSASTICTPHHLSGRCSGQDLEGRDELSPSTVLATCHTFKMGARVFWGPPM